MTTNPTGRARARHAAQAVRLTARGLAAAAVLGVVASGLTASRATAQDIPIPSVSIPKAAATRAAAATNAHTAAMQQVDAPVTPRSNATTSATAPARAGTMTPIAVSAPVAGTATHGKTTGAATPASPTAVKGSAAMTAAPMSADTEPMSISVTQRGVKGEVSLNREVYSYDQGARRDPFISLMRSGDLRPMLSDLRLVTVLYDPTGQSSIAVMRDESTKDQYRVRVGQTLGRMRVAQIQPKQVVFTIEEVGFSRQEALALGDSTKARTQ